MFTLAWKELEMSVIPFGESCVLNDGRRVVTPWRVRGVYIGEQKFDGPVLLRPDAALTLGGHVWVVAAHAFVPGGSVWLDAVRQWWKIPHPVYGSRMICRAVGEDCQIALTTTADNWIWLRVTPAGAFSTVATGKIPDRSGGNGMRDWDAAGHPRTMAPLDQVLLGHKVRGQLDQGTGTTIAGALPPLPDQTVIARGAQIGTLSMGLGAELRLSANGKYWAATRYEGEHMLGGVIPASIPPLQAGTTPPIDPPVEPPIEPPPIEPPTEPPPTKPPEPPMPTTRTGGFLTWLKKFITAENGGDASGILHAVDRPGTPPPPQQVKSWETMTLERVAPGKVLVRTTNATYWKAEGANTTTYLAPGAIVTCYEKHPNRNPDSWELFYDIDNGDGTISLKSMFNFYVCCEADGRIVCNRTAIGPYEKFILLPVGSGVPDAPKPVEPGTTLPQLVAHPNSPIMNAGAEPWRLKGYTGFKLAELWRTGGPWSAFVNAYPGFNTVRVFAYTEGPNWTDPTWDSPSPQDCVHFVRTMNALGIYVWWVLLTSSNRARLQPALDQIAAFTQARTLGLLLQGANEPERQNPDTTLIDTTPLHAALAASGYPWDNGYIDNTQKHAGTFWDAHTKRDGGHKPDGTPLGEWPRRCHDAMDIYSPPADAPAGTVALKMPGFLGEPPKPEDVGASVVDWKGYFGGGALFSAGVVFHSKTGKFCELPTPTERQLAAAALMGLNAYPPDATRGTYRRIDGDGLRTYQKLQDGDFTGNVMVRIRPTHPEPPEPGWTSLDTDHVLYRK